MTFEYNLDDNVLYDPLYTEEKEFDAVIEGRERNSDGEEHYTVYIPAVSRKEEYVVTEELELQG